MAWKRRSRPCLADPPAESPSTMYSSQSAGSRSWQSASLPGSELPSSAPLRRTRSRALRAASRARAASIALPMTRLATAGFSSRKAPSLSLTIASTMPLTSVLPSLVLVWPSNCGCGILTLMTAVRPSRISSPRDALLEVLREIVLGGVGVDRPRQRGLEPRQMRAAFVRVDVVGEGVNRFAIAVVPLQRDFGVDALALAAHVDRLLVDQRLVRVQVRDERDDAAFVVKIDAACRRARRRA